MTEFPAKRLIVFVHGFFGHARKTWADFATTLPSKKWWDEADLVFVQFSTAGDTINGMSANLSRLLKEYYPHPPASLLAPAGNAIRIQTEPYREIILVGHSMGGVVIRNTLLQEVRRASAEGGPLSPIANATVRLFSPATAGMRLTGPYALGARVLKPLLDFILHYQSAFYDLKEYTPFLRRLQRETERKAVRLCYPALRASVLWAKPDRIVHDDSYSTDPPALYMAKKGHLSVCKPRDSYQAPFEFVKTGRI